MSDEVSSSNFYMFTPEGVKVQITLRPGADVAAQIDLAMKGVAVAIAAGMTVREPVLGAGEHVTPVEHVVVGRKTNKDGTRTPMVFLYHPGFSYPSLKVYLNTPFDIQYFEEATGLSLEDLRIYVAPVAPKLRDDPETDALYVARPAKPTRAIWSDNPKWGPSLSDEEKKRVSKRRFLRWDGVNYRKFGDGDDDASVGNNDEEPPAKPLVRQREAAPAGSGVRKYNFTSDIVAAVRLSLAESGGYGEVEVARWMSGLVRHVRVNHPNAKQDSLVDLLTDEQIEEHVANIPDWVRRGEEGGHLAPPKKVQR